MRTQSPDTSEKIERTQIERLRRMTPTERAGLVAMLNARAQAIQMAGIRSRHPDADETELLMRLRSLWFDRDTMVRVFNWDPEVHGWG